MNHRAIALAAFALALALASAPAAAELRPDGRWADGARSGAPAIDVAIASSSPFTLADALAGEAPAATARVTFYPAAGASAQNPAPAVVLLHGAGGVSAAREGRYAREFAAQGVAVAVIDVFGARGGGGFVDRLMRTTEAMAIADGFATLAFLDGRPDVDASRVALIGFSYGAMSTVYAAFQQVVEAYAPVGTFAAHIAFYGPCIARFERIETTGAPVLLLWGERDEIVDPDACVALAGDLSAGGSRVAIERYDAAHRWDGPPSRWRASVHIADCALTVGRDGLAVDTRTGLAMTGPELRATILSLCVNRDGYLIEGDEAVRVRSNAAMARFLNPVLFPTAD